MAGRPRVRRAGETDAQFAARCAHLDLRKAQKAEAHDRKVLGQHVDKIPLAVERALAPLEGVVTRLSEHLRTTAQEQASLVDAMRSAAEEVRQCTVEVRALAEAIFRVAEHWERARPPAPASSVIVRPPPPPPAPPLPPFDANEDRMGLWANTKDGATAIDLYRQMLRLDPTAADVLALREILLLCDQVAGQHSGTAGDGFPILQATLQQYAADTSPVKSALDLQVRLHHFLPKE